LIQFISLYPDPYSDLDLKIASQYCFLSNIRLFVICLWTTLTLAAVCCTW